MFIFAILIIFNVFNNINSDLQLKSQISSINLLKSQIDYLCDNPADQLSFNLNLPNTKKEFYLKNINNNSLCLYSFNNKTYCERFKCEILSNEILVNHTETKNNYQSYSCYLDKLNITSINISCDKSYNY